MELDLAGQLGRRQAIDVDPAQRVDHPDPLHGRAQRLADPHHVALADQVLDDVRARGGRADPLLVQRRGIILVVDLLARVLHQREQPRLGDPRGRLGLLRLARRLERAHRDVARLLGARDQRGQRRLLLAVASVGEHRAPARHDQGARARAEALACGNRRALDALPLRGRVERAEEPARDEIEQTLVVARERPARQRPGRHDREVVGHAGVVEDARVVLEAILAQPRGRGGQVGEALVAAPVLRERRERLRHDLAVVLGQALAARARIGEQLVALVAALRRRQRAARRPREAPVRLALEAGQVE